MRYLRRNVPLQHVLQVDMHLTRPTSPTLQTRTLPLWALPGGHGTELLCTMLRWQRVPTVFYSSSLVLSNFLLGLEALFSPRHTGWRLNLLHDLYSGYPHPK